MNIKKVESGLSCLFQGMKGKKIYIELRNENYVFGNLEECDSFLNIKVKDATVIRNASSCSADEFFVSGRHIRFIHFEHQVDAQAVIRRYFKGKYKKKLSKKLDQMQSDVGRQVFKS